MFDFRMVDHQFKREEKIIEIWNGEELMGAIYPTENGVKIVSKFLPNDPEEAIEIDRGKLPPVPAILIKLFKAT